MTGKRWLFLFPCAMAAAIAHAQSQFAGSWSGSITFQSNSTCTTTGPGVNTTDSISCTIKIPWSGTVDAQGNTALTEGAGSETCSDGSTFAIPAGMTPLFAGVIPANGTISQPAFSSSSGGVNISCSAFDIVFHLPASVSGAYSCTDSSTQTSGGFTTTCNGTEQATYSGGLGSGALTILPPKFPMTVSSNITSATATATAQVSPPPAQVGTTGSVYVFAHVRQSKLSPAPMTQQPRRMTPPSPVRQDDGSGPDPCVLAQLSPNGQLTAASASNLQAYTTGVLSSQGQSVTILNNVPTPNVSGASFFVGYGSSSSNMVSTGTYQGAVSVTGASGCSAALLTGAAPLSPSALSGLWWNPNESGWGVSFTQRRNVVFGAWYTYDSAGKPKWYVASNCALPAGVTGTSGTCTGQLYQVSGPTFFTGTFDPSHDNVAAIGNFSVAFTDANHANMTYSVNGQGRTVAIVRQSVGTGNTAAVVDFTDLWWNPNESGWGMVMTQQLGNVFIAWYVYDNSGNPVWYVIPNCTLAGSSCSGTAYSTTGPPLGPAFDPTAVHATAVGSLTLDFLDANNASASYTINGVTGTKAITRQTF
jgi:hypothetical protein